MQLIAFAITWLFVRFRGRIASERGQDLLEYALLGGLIAAAIVALLGAGIMSGAVSSMVNNISYCIDFENDPANPCNISLP